MQCLDYALTKWTEEGGYLLLSKSTHWCMPHVLHWDASRENLTHYIPHESLKQPWYAIFGFDGKIETNDKDIREPIKAICVLFGTLTLLILGGVLVVKRKIKQCLKRYRK